MDDTGQAGDSPETIDDLATFLGNNPDADRDEAADQGEEHPSDETLADTSEETDSDSPADDEGDEKPDSEDAKEQPSGLKFKVPVKGEDGSDASIEVDEKELIAGYQRHADYTRKTQELANKEREAFSVVTTKIEEQRSHYLQQAQLAHAAVRQLAGLRSPEDMAVLAQTDPAQWVAEQQRERAIQGVLGQLEQSAQQERTQAQQQQQQAARERFQKAWDVLSKEGVDRPKLQGIFEGIQKNYGVPQERFAHLDDPALVLVMRDAVAYRQLQAKRADVTKKVEAAPKLPAARQSLPRNEQLNKKLDARFARGKAKLSDLSAYLSANDL